MNAAGWIQYHSLSRHLARMVAAGPSDPIIHSDGMAEFARQEHEAACARLRGKLDRMKAQLPAVPATRRKRGGR